MIELSRSERFFNFKHFNSVNSTNDTAMRLALEGHKPWTVVFADEQTKGRGRLGREWVSAKGNIFYSIILDPDLKINCVPQLNFVAALATYDTLEPYLPKKVDFGFKWPNDLLLNKKKFCGVLIESNFIGETLNQLILGMGINFASFPKNTIFPATSLQDIGCRGLTRAIFLEKFLQNLRKYFVNWRSRGFNRIKKAWLKRAYKLNQKVTLNTDGKKNIGKFVDIDNSGQIILVLSNGKKKLFNVGDILN